MHKITMTGSQAREKLAKGAFQLYDAVSRTLGPYGENFFLEKKHKPTNDGITIAREIQLKDEVENLGVIAIREASVKTVEEAGDGTTTAIILAWKIYENVSRFLQKTGTFSGKMKGTEAVRKIKAETEEVIQKLVAMAKPIETREDLINSAIVATEDKELGELIGGAQWDLGKDGYLLAEEDTERKSSIERVKGIKIDNGFGTSQIVNNQEKQILEVTDSKLILTTYVLSDLKPFETIISDLVKTGVRTITIVARAWTEEGVKVCLQNINGTGGVKIYPLNAPYVDMQERMKDMSAVFGATFFDSETSDLSDAKIQDVGYAKKIVANRFSAILTGVDDVPSKARVQKRIEELKQRLTGDPSEFMKKTYLERIAQLENGFAIVKVGASSDMERKRLFDKAEDAVNAVRAAFQEGTVPGAGLAFKEIAESLPDDYLLKKPLMSIYEQIMSSSPEGFVIEDWVRDPVKVLRVALERASSSAASFATAGGVVVTELRKPLDEVIGPAIKNSQNEDNKTD